MLPANYSDREEFFEEAFRALEVACGGQPKPQHVRRLHEYLFALFCSSYEQRQKGSPPTLVKTAQELQRYLDKLNNRSGLSDHITIKSFLALSETAQALVGPMIALETHQLVDSFYDIDFSNAVHFTALKRAVTRARDQISSNVGRPRDDILDQFYFNITVFARDELGADIRVGNHRKGHPVTPFERMVVAGHRLIDVWISYHGIVKRYTEAMKHR